LDRVLILEYLSPMRLEKIKLAGFKSFVDPTTVHFPGNLSGVVGPNGCGKSNVIDAVRWVMGESSAKMLRGQSMADVIFNGSSGRQPVGVAAIELVFDNGDGSAGGEYAKFAQISVKRQVSRDGQSLYFLNGARCRRRDIQDLFLGTGLGPRSYAIIEQGMISRLIEAKPEDLRLFLEEAAGISKYKERRRETETRMRHTQDNLDRLDDLREEVAKQLAHLERQAAVAEKYQALRRKERRIEAELKTLRWHALDREATTKDAALRAEETALEGRIAHQRQLEADALRLRQDYVAASDRFNEIQGNYYAVGAEIARLEQGIRFARENRRRQEGEIARLEQESAALEDALGRDRETLAELDQGLARDLPEQRAAQGALAQAEADAAAAAAELALWEGQWDAFNRRATVPAQTAEVERARIDHLEQQAQRERARKLQVEAEMERLTTDALGVQIEDLRREEDDCRREIDRLAAEEERLAGALGEEEAGLEEADEALDLARTELQSARGRASSLLALREAALAGPDEAAAGWLQDRGLAGAPRLADQLDVAPGWEPAVEAVLAGHLRAVCTDSLDRFASAQGVAGIASLALLDAQAGESQTPAGSLLEQVRCPWPLHPLLGRVRGVQDLPEALRTRSSLAPGEVLVTTDGVLVGHNWLRTPETNGSLGGLLAHTEELKGLQSEIETLEGRVEGLMQEQERRRARRRQVAEARDAIRSAAAVRTKDLAHVRAELMGLGARLEHQNERRAALETERAALAEGLAEATGELEEARERLYEALEAIDTLADERQGLAERRQALREAVAAAQEVERARRDLVHRLTVAIETGRASREARQRSLARIEDQEARLRERLDEIRDSLEAAVAPLAEQEAKLGDELARRLAVEARLAAARNAMEELDGRVRALEQERHQVEREVGERRRALDALRLALQEVLVRRRTLEEQLAEDGLDPRGLLADLGADAGEEAWQEQLEKVRAQIARLGNINLAAIEEFGEKSERKRYLDEQHADIARALATLEQAIRRIDRETRARFKDTFERVNQGFQQLFPRLFGGGHAYLELTGEDLLETGVSVMARPPGKRNASIHLLSGGEKALTAVAMVFAIFELNPAPFCMLDEVDAPLDDANVGRFCELVRAMSQRVQFIFITHNKVTMEIADHLLGVTMQEPGVSRLVSVDVEEATRLAAVS